MENLKRWLFNERVIIEEIMLTLSANIVSLFVLVGTICAAAGPALFVAVSVYYSRLDAGWSNILALTTAFAVGAALEGVGVVSAYVTLKQYAAWQANKSDVVRLALSVLLVLGYAGGVDAIILGIGILDPVATALGVGMPWLGVALYLGRGLLQELADDEAAQHKKTEAQLTADLLEIKTKTADKKELTLARMQLKHEEKMAVLTPVRNVPRNDNGTAKERFETWVEQGNDPRSMSAQALADKFGVGKTTAWRWQK